jgi:hypothetical protein
MDPSWSERDRSDGPPQGRCAPAVAGRLRRSLPRPAAAVVGRARSGRRNGPFGQTKEQVLAEPGGRWSVGQSGVRPSGVVMAEPIGKSVLARLRGGVGLRAGPLAQAGLYEPLGLTVGARGVGFGADVAPPRGAARLPPMVAAISRAVVGHEQASQPAPPSAEMPDGGWAIDIVQLSTGTAGMSRSADGDKHRSTQSLAGDGWRRFSLAVQLSPITNSRKQRWMAQRALISLANPHKASAGLSSKYAITH